jgi:hypothetical protein
LAGGQKKVVVRKLGGELAWGYLSGRGFVSGDHLDVMDPAGKVTQFLLSEIQWIAYVRDFNLTDRVEPEQMGRRSFQGRPRQGGLWVRLRLVSEDEIEGVADFDLAGLDGMVEDRGLMLTPPDGRGNTLRLFVPRSSVAGMEVLGWVAAGAKKPAKKVAEAEKQPGLFGE